MKKEIEWLLFDSGVSNYQISRATGISQVVLSKYATGKSDVGKMTLDNAERLYEYYKEVLKSMLKKWDVAIVNDQAVSVSDKEGMRYTCHLEKHGDVFLDKKGNQHRNKILTLEGVVIRPITPMVTTTPNPRGNILGMKKEDAAAIRELLCDMEALESGALAVEDFEAKYKGVVGGLD